MGLNNNVNVVGNITRDPEMRFTANGTAVVNFGLAWNKRRQDGEEEVSFFEISCFGSLAENVSESLEKGSRVVVLGTLSQRSWESQSGDRRSKIEIVADEVAPSLRWAAAKVTRNEFRSDRGGGGRGGDHRSRGRDSSSYSTDGGRSKHAAKADSGSYNMDEEPF